MSTSAPQETSPSSTYRLMALAALAIAVLLSVVIFSFSKMQSLPWASSLTTPDIKVSNPQTLPSFQADAGGVLKPELLEGKWTLISFWSVTCLPCLKELPALNQLALSWQGPELQIITVNLDKDQAEDHEVAKKFLMEEDISLPTAFDEKAKIKTAFAVSEIPSHFLISPTGQIVWRERGAFAWNTSAVRDQLVKLMETQSPDPNSESNP